MSELGPCSVCARHIRRSETECPFCGAAVESSAGRGRDVCGPRRSPRAALALAGRSALAVAGGSALALAGMSALGACNAAYGGPPPTADTNQAPAYGGPPPRVLLDAEPTTPPPATFDAGTGAGKDAGTATKPAPNLHDLPAPAYGGPPPKH